MAVFDLERFLPYLLAQAAEQASAGFSRYYKERYGMLRTEWRVLFHLGTYGTQTARAICDRGALHKTKVSRAVKALEDKRFLKRATLDTDRRNEALSLTARGQAAFEDLVAAAERYEAELVKHLSPEDLGTLRTWLIELARAKT